MKIYKKKGSALIIAVMISVILVITSVGFLTVTNWTSDIANRGFNNTRLYWAAESGANQALRWIRRLKVIHFADKTEAIKAQKHFNSSKNLSIIRFYSGTKDEIVVRLNLYYIAAESGWKVSSTATRNGKKAKIVLDKIKTTSIAKYAFGWSDNMSLGTRFLDGDIIDGEIYAGGTLNCGVGRYKHPIFRSLVSLANTTAGSSLDESYTDGEFNRGDRILNWLLTENTSKPGNFSTGLKITNHGGEPSDDSQFREMMDATFQGGIELIDQIDPQHGVCYDWSDLNNTGNTIKELSRYTLGAAGSGTEGLFNDQGEKVKIKFEGNKAKIYKKYWYAGGTWGWGKKWKYELKKTLSIGTGSGEYNTILIPACNSVDSEHKSGYSYVEIEGNLSASAAVVTEKNDVVITGDITYDNINYDQSYKDIQDDINTEINTPKFSILAGIGYPLNSAVQYKGDILVNSHSDIQTSATIFTPEGIFGGFGIQANGEYYAKQGYNIVIKNYGSLIMAKKGIWHNGAGYINPRFYDDLRYKDFQVKPLVYIPSVGNDIVQKSVNIINDGYTWTVSYE